MKIFSLFIFLTLNHLITFGQQTIILQANKPKYDINFGQIEYFEDPSNQLTFNQIRQVKFTKSSKTSLNSGYSNSKFWYKIKLKSLAKSRWIFNISGTLVDQIGFYEIFKNGDIKHRVSGDFYPFSNREIKAPTFSFYMNFQEIEERDLIISIKSNDTKQFSFLVRSEAYFNSAIYEIMFRWFFYFGMLFMMVVYNLLLFSSLRDITYLYYVLYIACFAMMQFAIFGYGNMFLWGENIWFGNRAPNFFAGFTTIFISLFSYKYLNIKYLLPKYKVIFYYLVGSGLFIAFLNMIVQPSPFTNQITALISLPNVLILLVIGTVVLLKGYAPAKYYMLAWGILFFSLAIFLINALGVFQKSNLISLILPFGSLVEVTLLSFALGKKITSSEKEKTNAQKEVVRQLQENEKVRSRIARDLHDDLGSTLSSIHILSEFAKKESKMHPEKLPQLLGKITTSTKKLQENLQDIVWTNQNKDNKIDSLLVHMRLFGGEILESKNIDYQININKKLAQSQLNSDLHYDIFMVYKETLNNIVKYSEATFVTINFDQVNTNLVLEIIDNGQGFDVNLERTSNGLKNMEYRAKNINGTIEIKSVLNYGTTVLLEVPVT